jgi:hypothetical protein
MQHEIPFYKNSPDSTRCVLACTRMILKMLEPEKEYSWEQLDEISGKKGSKEYGLGVWHFGVLIYLAAVAQRAGSTVVVFEQFPYALFRWFPVTTCLYFFGPRAGMWQVMLSHLRTEARMIPAFLKAFANSDRLSLSERIERVPALTDLIHYLDSGYVCLVQLNGYMLDGESGYGGHMVLVVGYDADSIIIHNPRLPGSAYRHYNCEVFAAAWHSPYSHCANLYAVKLPTPPLKALH